MPEQREKHLPTYSTIISPDVYSRLMTDEHVYIKASDVAIANVVEREVALKGEPIEVVEYGCGPARALQRTARVSGIHVTGVDHDPEFIEYGRNLLQRQHLYADLVLADAETYMHPKPVDVFYSQGVHHHIQKGEATRRYLKGIYDQLKPGGMYIVSDEFIPEYATIEERRTRLVIWYSHVIANAQRGEYQLLAQEEAKTLLDDLNEVVDPEAIKTQKQIELVLHSAQLINGNAIKKHMEQAEGLADEFLKKLQTLRNTEEQGDKTIDLSRGDYKICDSEFKREIEVAGFVVEEIQAIGPIENIGAMVVYVLRKPLNKVVR